MNYYYSIDGKEVVGPCAFDQLKDQYLSGLLSPETQVCAEGTDAWEMLASIVPPASPEASHQPTSLMQKCPACEKSIMAESVICVNCGLDLRNGRRISQPTEPSVVTTDQRNRIKASDHGGSRVPQEAEQGGNTSEIALSSWCQAIFRFDLVWSFVLMGLLSIWFFPVVIDQVIEHTRGGKQANSLLGLIVSTYVMYGLSIASDRKLLARRPDGFGFAIATLTLTIMVIVARLAGALENGRFVSSGSVFYGREWILLAVLTIVSVGYGLVWFRAALDTKEKSLPSGKWSPPAEPQELNPVVKKILWATLIYPLWVYPIVNGIHLARSKGLSPHWFWFGIHPLGGWITYAIIRRKRRDPSQPEMPGE